MKASTKVGLFSVPAEAVTDCLLQKTEQRRFNGRRGFVAGI